MSIHRVQQFILAQLSEHASLRYSDMRPSSMEASQFMYHLHKLIEQELVVKNADGSYALAAQGHLHVDRADETLSLRAQPRLAAMIVCRHPDKGYLYSRIDVQPALGHIGFPIVDIALGFPGPLGEYINDSFHKLSGLKVRLRHRADGYINLEAGDELKGSLMAHVFEAEYLDGEPKPELIWSQELSPEDKSLILKSNHFIEQALETTADFFFFEYSFQ